MTWEIDPTHSHVSFAIRVMSVSTTRGRFNVLRGSRAVGSWPVARTAGAKAHIHKAILRGAEAPLFHVTTRVCDLPKPLQSSLRSLDQRGGLGEVRMPLCTRVVPTL